MSLWCTAELARQNTCIEAAIHVTETDQQCSETPGFVTVTDCHRDLRRIGISRWLYCNPLFMKVHDNVRFCPFSQKGSGTIFKVRNFKVSADKSECVKFSSSNKCLDLMHTKFYGSVAPASWSGSELFSPPSYDTFPFSGHY